MEISGRDGIALRVEPLHPRYADGLAALVLASESPDRLALAATLHDYLWIETFTLVALVSSRVGGFLLGEARGDEAVVTWLFVARDVRRLGAGTALLGAFGARARLDGCVTLVVETPPRPDDDGAAVDTFLRAAGLEPDGARARYVGTVERVSRGRRG